MSRRNGLLTGLLVGLTVGLLVASAVGQPGKAGKDEWNKEFFDPLRWAIRQIEARYVEEVDPQKLLVGAYQGILNELDDYSSYIPPDRLEEFQGDTMGQFGGLGIQIRFLPQERILRVEQPIPGTPAFRLGVLSGDLITRVREEATGEVFETSEFKDVHEAVRVLRGEPGTEVTITVVHKGSREEEEITVKREIIKIPGVRGAQVLDEKWKIGYLYVPYFHEGTPRDLKMAIEELKDQGLKALIMDLRFNPGGLLSSAVGVSDLFLTRGLVVSTRGRASPEHIFKARRDDILGGAPLIVLVNRHSASASEIVAGAIKDNHRGLVIGETTYGKGSVQSIIPLKGERSAIKLTTAKYYMPSGLCIHETGVEPDVSIELTDQQTRQLARKIADVAEYPPPPPEEELEEGEKPPEPQGPSEQDGEEESEEPFRDVQLERALDVLIGMLIQQQRTEQAEAVEVGAR